ncbi:TRAP transporter large permease [Phenylobacterium terrae]|uniref:TRAP transporter large permease protein n=1 Tax=Phenylobacterium terrae TaxID=2665495 RepID=A0ABW4MVI6_9CAUL
MTPEALGLLGVVLLLVLLAAGVRIAVALGVVGIGGLAVLISPEAALIKSGVVAFEVVSKYELGVLPLFLLMAHLAFSAGASRDFFDAAAKFVGHRPGGLALASIAGCAGFGAISGSSLATVATIGLVALPEMRRAGYSPALATGALAAGGTLGVLIPPSAALIVFGILAEQSIGRLFTAAIIPGLTQALFYMAVIYLLCKWRPALGPVSPRAGWRERFAAIRRLADVGLLVILVIGGIAVGWFSPTEAAAVGTVGALGIGLWRRRLDWATLKKAMRETLETSGMIYAIVIAAIVFSTFIAATGFGERVAGLIESLDAGPLGVILVLVVLLLVLGMFLDGLAMMTLTIPIFLPLVQEMGIDPIWFGILMVRTMEIGFVHPPVGMNVYVVHSLARDIPLMSVFKGIVPFLVADLAHVALLIAVPGLALFLPELLGA